MSRGPDAATLLRQALVRDARAAGCAVTVITTQATRWASATFTGARHRVTLAVIGPAVDAWIDHLPDAEFALPGHLVADLTIESRMRDASGTTLVLEALTVETCA